MKAAYKITFLVLFSLFVCVIPVFAYSEKSLSDLAYDTTLVDENSIKYSTPTQIFINQITTLSSELEKNPELWAKNLYYYSITRLNFPDIPYNYLVDSNGTIYDGKTGGIGSNSDIKDNQSTILIGYLSNDPILTNRASSSMYSLVDTIASSWGINTVQAVNLSISQEDGKISQLEYSKNTGELNQSVSELFTSWKGYEKENLEYKAKIEKVEYNDSVEVGQKLHVKITVKNLNDFAWITDKNPIYISTSDAKDSNFSINGVWDSFSKPTHIQNVTVKPGEEATFEFDLLAQIKPEEVTQTFILEKFDKQPFENSQFDVKFTIVKGDKSLVEVNSPQYGFANIRECQWYSCKILDSADNGTVYILLKEENGWMEVQFDEDTVGWVYSKYMKKL